MPNLSSLKSSALSTGAGRRVAPLIHSGREAALAARARMIDRRPERKARVEWLSRGLPVPPASLRTKVIRNSDALNFLTSGRDHQAFIDELLKRNEIDLEGARVLDFGCGCGRVLRWWWPLAKAEFWGSDLNPQLARWCDQNLPLVAASANGALPPTSYGDGFFDFIYSISIFTHLPLSQQQPWLDELTRITKPGGHLMLTVAGSAYEPELGPDELATYQAGDLVVRFDDSAGSNLCAVFHPPGFLTDVIVPRAGLELVERVPGDPAANMRQDVYLLRREN